MNKSPKEIKDSIDKFIKDDKKHSKDEFELAINNAFISSEIEKQKRMKSTIDLNVATNQNVGIVNELTTNSFSSFFKITKLFYLSNWKWIFISILVSIIISFFAYGILFAFLPSDAITIQKIQIQIAVSVYFSVIIIPMFLFIFWGFTNWILELRSDNLIARMRMDGVTKIQFIVFTFILILMSMLLIEFILGYFWMPMLNLFSMSLHGSKNDEFYLWTQVSLFAVILKTIILILAIFNISIIVGFKLENKKTFSNIVLGLFVFTVLIFVIDFKTYNDYKFSSLGNNSWLGVVFVSIRWLNPIYISGNHLLTSLIPNVPNDINQSYGLYGTWFETLMNVVIIGLTFATSAMIITFSSNVIKYKPLR